MYFNIVQWPLLGGSSLDQSVRLPPSPFYSWSPALKWTLICFNLFNWANRAAGSLEINQWADFVMTFNNCGASLHNGVVFCFRINTEKREKQSTVCIWIASVFQSFRICFPIKEQSWQSLVYCPQAWGIVRIYCMSILFEGWFPL